MKTTPYIAIVGLAIAFAACSPNAPEQSALILTEEQVNETTADGKIYTINELIDTYMTEEGNFLSDTTLYPTRGKTTDNGYLYSIDLFPTDGPGIYVRGRVTTDDQGGNFYKSLVIQQIVNGKQQNLRLSVDLGSVSGMYPRGQEILIRCNGLALGRYANQPQLCVPSYDNNTNKTNYLSKIGWKPGRIPAPLCKSHIQRIGTPDASKLQYDTITIAEATANYSDYRAARKIDGRLIVIKDIWFTGQYVNNGSLATCETANPDSSTNANVFAPTTGNVGYPQSRVISDGTSNWTCVSTSEYADFAYFYLPYEGEKNAPVYGTYKGTVRGVLGFYYDNGSYSPENDSWSISICDLSDLDLKKADGTMWVPVEYGSNE